MEDEQLRDWGLYTPEIRWRDHQHWLEERGYILRPRLRHGWVPSWKGTKQSWLFCEDGASIIGPWVDATRISDGAIVVLKRISKNSFPHEVEISRMFSVEPLASDPRNHCVPVYEVMQSPLDDDIVFIVIPFLRPFEKPPFRTVGEALECMRQLIQGLHLMHEHRLAHRQDNNVMMSPVPFLSEMPHPCFPKKSYDFRRRIKYTTRTAARPKYYFIDFGISYIYPKDCVAPRAPPLRLGILTVPEFQGSGQDKLHDPFPVDIYCLGELFRSIFTEEYYGLKMLEPLIADMIQTDPVKRPTAAHVSLRFNEIITSVRSWQLRSRLVRKEEFGVVGLFKAISHAFRTARYIVSRTPALPTPPSR
ncbi:uncharacterized protein BXZ73DRAFT_88426 [Epithele typhae]|uniref:uncharacterized protein n=1 Tax=Epithele typhae TaxID=378194 RepID=UPI002008C718|nr:uncharacterized protein BXZ73DRAFT_88426 [Epithele typhae]KAH9941283.1 hypothetical protein BXZ73DRAFT_88426 [Epithele typhae]